MGKTIKPVPPPEPKLRIHNIGEPDEITVNFNYPPKNFLWEFLGSSHYLTGENFVADVECFGNRWNRVYPIQTDIWEKKCVGILFAKYAESGRPLECHEFEKTIQSATENFIRDVEMACPVPTMWEQSYRPACYYSVTNLGFSGRYHVTRFIFIVFIPAVFDPTYKTKLTCSPQGCFLDKTGLTGFPYLY